MHETLCVPLESEKFIVRLFEDDDYEEENVLYDIFRFLHFVVLKNISGWRDN